MGNLSGAAGLSPPTATRKKSAAVSVANLFLYIAILISGWQAMLYFGSRYNHSYTDSLLNRFNATDYSHYFNSLIQSTDSATTQNIGTPRRSSRVESLHSAISGLSERLERSWEKSEEKFKRNHAELEGKVLQIQDEVLKAIGSVQNRLDSLERSGSVIENNVTRLRTNADVVEKKLQERSSRLEKSLSSHLGMSVEFHSLKDVSKGKKDGDEGFHGFMSQLIGRGRKEGPPELFSIPSKLTGGRLLCLRGNDTKNGTLNSYAFAFQEGLPEHAVLLPGTTLISETYWDYNNPWHAMYNLIQFVHWKITASQCRSAQRLILYHWSELRTELGYWIKNVFDSVLLPSVPESLSYENRPVCFNQVVVSRIGIGGVPGAMMEPIFRQVRCTARRKCGVSARHIRSVKKSDLHRTVRVTLMARSGARGFRNLRDWETVIKARCKVEKSCFWSTIFVSNLTFCEQVEAMSKTDVLVTVHGAQMTNMVFMSPGSRIMEMFPRGWEEFAGHGQFIYSHLANWVGLVHEGYWRDSKTSECPTPSDPEKCFSFYKDQSVGINSTYVSSWLARVVDSFNASQGKALLRYKSQHPVPVPVPQGNQINRTILPEENFKWDNRTCVCGI